MDSEHRNILMKESRKQSSLANTFEITKETDYFFEVTQYSRRMVEGFDRVIGKYLVYPSYFYER